MTTWKQPFSINRVAHSLIPHRHRTLRMVAWVKVFVSYLIYIKELLYTFWDTTWLDVSITPQIAYIEKALNLATGQTDIFIDEGLSLGPWIFTITEDPSVDFYMGDGTVDDEYVYGSGDAVEVDFVVNIPEAVTGDIPLIAALTHRYKLPGKSFIIQTF